VPDWKIAMLLMLPLMIGGAKPRVWFVMFGASALAAIFPHPPAWLMIDLLAGALVLRRPAGQAQRLIGLIFAGMAMFDIGFLIGGSRDTIAFTGFLACLGWVQFVILLAWGLHDHFGHCFRRLGSAGSETPAQPGS